MKISKVKKENYIQIQGWMVTELNLKGNELLIYAIIYGFSQDNESKFTGSCSYLCDWTNSSKQSVFKCLKSLCEKGYLERFNNAINGVTLVDYRSTKFRGVVNKVDGGSQQSSPGGSQQSLPGGSQQSLPHSIEIDNIEIYNKEDIKKDIKIKISEIEKESILMLDRFNHFFKSKFTNHLSFLKNYEKWRQIYQAPEIEKAIFNSSQDLFWKDKMTPEIFFRLKNPNKEDIDNIGKFLNAKGEKTHQDKANDGSIEAIKILMEKNKKRFENEKV